MDAILFHYVLVQYSNRWSITQNKAHRQTIWIPNPNHLIPTVLILMIYINQDREPCSVSPFVVGKIRRFSRPLMWFKRQNAPSCRRYLQLGSEYRTSLVFKWSKVVRSLNSPLFECHLNTGLNFVRYSDHHLNTGPVIKWWFEYQTTIWIPEKWKFNIQMFAIQIPKYFLIFLPFLNWLQSAVIATQDTNY